MSPVPLPEPGLTDVTDPPSPAAGAVRRMVLWIDAHGRQTTDPDAVSWAQIDYYDEDGSPVLSMRVVPDAPNGRD